MPSPAIGIDLGTTYSCVAVFQHGKVEIIANEHGNRTTPSYVAFTDTERLVGEVAKRQAARNPENTVFDVKRMIGRHFDDSSVQQELKLWPFTVVNDRNNPVISVEYKSEGRRFVPEEISSMVLIKMKETAEAYLGERVTNAVITVPAYFNNQQRSATADAGKIAGLDVKRIINEPTAAALAYGLDNNLRSKRKVLIFDLGGGTFDVSILNISGGPVFEVLSTAGDTHLGGQDFDNRMIMYFAEEFKRKHKKDLTGSAPAMRKLKAACEEAKRTLSSSTEAFIEIDSLYRGIYFHNKISRARFEEMCIDLFRRTLEPVERAMRDAKLEKSSIDEVVLVGGSTRIPKVQKLLQNFFHGKKLNMNINPDEAVAYGAAIQAASLSADCSDPVSQLVLQDVVPLSLGLEVGGLLMEKMIVRNTATPVRRQQTFSLAAEQQQGASIRVFEGERALSKDNNLLGEFTITGLTNRRRGEPGVLVTFDVDANGILSVSAADPTAASNSMRITISEKNGRLSARAIEEMLKDASKFRAEDDAIRARAAAKNQLEGYVLSAGRAVEDAGDRASAADRETARKTCQEVTEWLERNSLAEKDELDDWMQTVQRQMSPILERIGRGGREEQFGQSSSVPGPSPAGARSRFQEARSGGEAGVSRSGGEEGRPQGDTSGQGGFSRGTFGAQGGPSAFEQSLRDEQSSGRGDATSIPSDEPIGSVMEEVD